MISHEQIVTGFNRQGKTLQRRLSAEQEPSASGLARIELSRRDGSNRGRCVVSSDGIGQFLNLKMESTREGRVVIFRAPRVLVG